MTDLWGAPMSATLSRKETAEASCPPHLLPWLAQGQSQVWTGRGAGQAGQSGLGGPYVSVAAGCEYGGWPPQGTGPGQGMRSAWVLEAVGHWLANLLSKHTASGAMSQDGCRKAPGPLEGQVTMGQGRAGWAQSFEHTVGGLGLGARLSWGWRPREGPTGRRTPGRQRVLQVPQGCLGWRQGGVGVVRQAPGFGRIVGPHLSGPLVGCFGAKRLEVRGPRP